MAYKFTKTGKNQIYIGTEEDKCYFCNKSLSGRECIAESDFFICLDTCS